MKKRTLKRITSAFLILMFVIGALFSVDFTAKAEDSAEGVAIFRLYNPNSGEHFYTSNQIERDNLILAGWNGEGYAWVSPASSNIPVYRVCNPSNGDHHYTTNETEKNLLVAGGWRDEGIGWYSSEAAVVPIFRQYNPNCTGAGSHNYTMNGNEAASLINAGWNDEGLGWYGLNADFPAYPAEPERPKPAPQPTPTPVIDNGNTGGTSTPAYSGTYIGNSNTHKFHKSNCGSVKKMKEKNKVTFSSRSEAINAGYTPCGNCHP